MTGELRISRASGHSPAESRELDRVAIEEVGIPGIVLMEHASLGAAHLCLEVLSGIEATPPYRARVVCGPGNNGGDGYAIARHLHNARVEVEVVELIDPARLDARSDPGVNRGVEAQRWHCPLPRPLSQRERGARAAGAALAPGLREEGSARRLHSLIVWR